MKIIKTNGIIAAYGSMAEMLFLIYSISKGKKNGNRFL